MSPTEQANKESKQNQPQENAAQAGGGGAVEGSLEGATANDGASTNNASGNEPAKDPNKKDSGGLKSVLKILRRFDIYFLLFILLIIIAVIVSYIAVQKNKAAKTPAVSTQQLDQGALTQINGNDTQIGGTNQTLDVQSSTVFGGDVLVKNDLQVAGQLKVAGSLSLPGITVSGVTDLGQVNANTLTLTGNETVKGQVTINQGLTVNGVVSISGALNASAITVTSLQVNGDITFYHHVYTTGSIPRYSNTAAIGGGGTSSVNGTDTAGNITINTGNNPSAACLVNVTFAQPYAVTPYIEVTPVGSGAANIGYYITRTTTGFSLCASSTPASNITFGFDYDIIG